MIVRSHNVEFGYELAAVLPYAYWHRKNGTLSSTVSAVGSDSLYFFSPHHSIDPSPRDWANTEAAKRIIPNMGIHRAELDEAQWEPPPIADYYRPQAITFDKPTVVIYNRYNFEWGAPPRNFFPLPVLRQLFDMLLPKYDVVYFNVRGQESLEDNAHSMDLGDYPMIRSEYPSVRVIHDLVDQHGGDYNLVQLRVFAGCRKFITMNGGPSMLASYFGGENIIYTQYCREILPRVNSFYGWYHKFNRKDPSVVRVVRKHSELLSAVKTLWVDRAPTLNILVRCHNRPNGFARLMASISDQGYPNVRVICSYDNDETLSYLKRYPVTRTRVKPSDPRPSPGTYDYRAWLASNEYLNTLAELVKDGFIMYVDDDDILEKGAAERIIGNVNEDTVLLWRVATREGRLVPSDQNMGRIVAGDISGIGVCFHSSHKHKARWTPWRRGDYRFIRDLCTQVRPKFIQDVLTRMGDRIDSPSQGQAAQMQRIRERAARILGAKK